MDAATEKEVPAKLEQKHLEYLDSLRESGITNMFGARPYLMDAFDDLSEDEAKEILQYWMRTFASRQATKQAAA